jgi:hypothetical protein
VNKSVLVDDPDRLRDALHGLPEECPGLPLT